MPETLRSRLLDIADEHERILAENMKISKENARLRLQVAEAVRGTVVDLDSPVDPKMLTLEIPSTEGMTLEDEAASEEDLVDPLPRDIPSEYLSSEMSPIPNFTSERSHASSNLSNWIGNSVALNPAKRNLFKTQALKVDDTVPEEAEPDLIPIRRSMIGRDPIGQDNQFDAAEVRMQPPSSPKMRSLQSAAVLSKWFNPDVEGEDAFAGHDTVGSEDRLRHIRVDTDTRIDGCTIYPFGSFRLSWDSFAFLCVLWELWVTPFELVFLDVAGTPTEFKVLSQCITCFFVIDIVLNFLTGYVEGDRTVMQRTLIVKNYMKFWLWIDIVATVPFDLIVETVTVDMFSIARMGKVSKGLKLLRYLKMVRAVRLLKSAEKAGHVTKHFTIIGPLRAIMAPLQVFIFLLVLAHVHGCLWAAFQPDWVAVETMRSALERYYESLYWAFIVLSAGIFNDASTSTPWLWTLEMIMALERLSLIAWGGKRFFKHNLGYLDEARQIVMEKTMLSYFRRHNVSFKTQIQALFSLTDVGAAKKRQTDCDLLTDLPHQLACVVRTELWSDRMQSLGLIREVSSWHDEFLSELAQMAEERVLPSKCVVFNYGAAAVATYCILDGECQVSMMADIPNFFPGMWIGENALVSSVLRYSATFYTQTMTSFMVLRGDDFRQLISKLDLMPQFERFCSDEVWKGLCGRCGSLGNHFSDRCPRVFDKGRRNLLQAQNETRKSASRRGNEEVFKSFPRQRSGSIASVGSGASLEAISSMNTGGTYDSATGMTNNPSFRNFSTAGSIAQGFSAVGSVGVIVNNLRGSRRSELSDSGPDQPVQVNRAVKRLLNESGLERLQGPLNSMGVTDLEDLERMDWEAFNNMLSVRSDRDLCMSSQEVRLLTPQHIQQFKEVNAQRVRDALFGGISRLHHLIFLSHYKVEAGTEAALMRTELEMAIAGSPSHPGNLFDDPVFLDSDNLQSLTDLQEKVKTAHNLVLLLTKNVLRRRWVLLEILTAKREGTRIILVDISKPGCQFMFPNEEFYERLRKGKFLDQSAMDLIVQCNFTLQDVEEALRGIFQLIATPYSPHKQTNIRRAEINALLEHCRLREEVQHITQRM